MNITIDVPDGKSGDWEISTFVVTKEDADFANLRAAISFSNAGQYIYPGTYKKLTYGGEIIMSNTPSEISDHLSFIYEVKTTGGDILINGLGLGVVLKAILEFSNIKSIIVIEKSQDVINLVAPTYLKDSRVKIIHADAFNWEPPKHVCYTSVWHDIWPTVTADNLSEMTKLHRKYDRRTNWQDSWRKGSCISQRDKNKKR